MIQKTDHGDDVLADDEEYCCSEKQVFDDNRFDILVFIIMKDRCFPFAAMILGREVPFG